MSTAAFAPATKAAPFAKSKGEQGSLSVNRPGDAYEREADRVAGEVMSSRSRIPHWSLSRIAMTAPVQRKCSCGGRDECEECKQKAVQRRSKNSEATDLAPRIVEETLRSPGRPLDHGAREFFESRLGHDLRSVRVHYDDQAAESARSVNAKAYTVGNHVVFGAGEYGKGSTQRELLAHELVHTLQQAGGRPLAGAGPAAPVAVARATDRMVARQVADGSREMTEEDAAKCSPLYLQKLCVKEEAGFGGDRSGVPEEDEMQRHDQKCRAESGYDGAGRVLLSGDEIKALSSPRCKRGDPEEARARAHAKRRQEILSRAGKYMVGAAAQELIDMVTDPIFITSVGVAVGVYLALWFAPEPLFTKIAAAATTIAVLSTGLFSISMIRKLAEMWMDLEAASDTAKTDEEIEAAAQAFGQRAGAAEVDLLVFLASLLIGGKLPTPKGVPAAGQALADAERALASAPKGGKVIQGPWGQAELTAPRVAKPAGGGGQSYGFDGTSALKVSPNLTPELAPAPEPQVSDPIPDNLRSLPAPKAKAATTPGTSPTPQAPPYSPVVPGVGKSTQTPQRPPFVLLLPQQKRVHMPTYQTWIGVLQSDPSYDRGVPAQRSRWMRSTRLGGSDAIPLWVYERGHQLGLTGEAGEDRVRIPDWTKDKKTIGMEVDHVIELQVTPPGMREEFDSMFNYELLDQAANGNSGNVLRANIQAERAKQVAFDPSAATRTLVFDSVDVKGGMEGSRWSLDEIKAGEQLAAIEP
jgi:hypothetical protein